jgi:hypothetical protein
LPELGHGRRFARFSPGDETGIIGALKRMREAR